MRNTLQALILAASVVTLPPSVSQAQLPDPSVDVQGKRASLDFEEKGSDGMDAPASE
ncbi:hypothetical protein [Azospirillum argentinense]|uniref:hypothetical protein n=1 Tax=Azospirillum argentinense TaxID=2970906 RepID=UPI00158645F2|nr:hypothetical protein [Azospirillum argentinense]